MKEKSKKSSVVTFSAKQEHRNFTLELKINDRRCHFRYHFLFSRPLKIPHTALPWNPISPTRSEKLNEREQQLKSTSLGKPDKLVPLFRWIQLYTDMIY